jgi:hypothetical protein
VPRSATLGRILANPWLQSWHAFAVLNNVIHFELLVTQMNRMIHHCQIAELH